MSGTPIRGDYIKAEGRAGRMGARLMAVVVQGNRQRVYVDPIPEHIGAARLAHPHWRPALRLPADRRAFWTPAYGVTTFGDLFTSRQLVALTTFSDLVGEAMEQIRRDAAAAGLPDDGVPLRQGGTGATAYAEAAGLYLGLVTDKCADYWSAICSWNAPP